MLMPERTNHKLAAGRALLQVFAVSLITSGFVFSASANERKTAIITFDVPGAGTGAFQGTQGLAISPHYHGPVL